MPSLFVCPHCQLQTLIDDEFAGRTGPCAQCGREVTTPPLEDLRAEPSSAKGARFPRGVFVLATLVILGLAAASVTILILIALVFPAVHAVQGRSNQQQCDQNLRRIGVALFAYRGEFGCLPPAFVAGPDGKPAHSWRVLILPYLGHRDLYDRYSFQEPWNGPQNSQLVSLMPEVFACPADRDSLAIGETNYMAIVGLNAAFASRQGRSASEFTDDLQTTMLVAEKVMSGVTWLEPVDLPADRSELTINSGMENAISSRHMRGAHVLMADGNVRFLREETPAETIEAMTTINGGEKTE